MKESYVEGLASYGGPESCVHIREGVGEALTGERAGRVSSRVIHAPRLRSREVRGAEALERQSWARRGHRPRACAETFRTGTGRSRVLLGHAVRREPHQSAS